MTLKSEEMAVSFDCETGPLFKDIKVGDTVTVQHSEEGGKKLATSVTQCKILLVPVKVLPVHACK